MMPTTAKSRYSKLPPQKATHLINSLLGSTCNLNSLLLGCLTIKCKCKRLNTGQRLPSRGGGGIRWGNSGIDGKYNLLLNGLAGRENTRDPQFRSEATQEQHPSARHSQFNISASARSVGCRGGRPSTREAGLFVLQLANL